MKKQLSAFVGSLPVIERHGSGDPEISGLAYDSREVESGFLFFALAGLHENGHRYVADAVARGARAVVHADPLPSYDPAVVYLRVADPRLSMSPVSADFFSRPSERLCVIGVTGTEGKSTTVFLVYQLLDLAGKRAGFISTVQYRVGADELPNPEHQTTPEATTIHEKLFRMLENGMEYAVVESSSHGLSARTNRLGDVAFDVAIMTNVTQEHLEFHGTLEQYRNDKANLFRALDRSVGAKATTAETNRFPVFGVVNADDPNSGLFRSATSKSVYSFSSKGNEADLAASDIVADSRGSSFTMLERTAGGILRHEARIELPGAFNVDNVLASLIAVSRVLEKPVAELVPLLPKLRPVWGRMTPIDEGQPFEVVMDYAHTPSSFETVLPPLKKRTRGRLICLFGSAGERDVVKRPRQGRIAADWCDILVLADEDPRGEEPRAILEEIAAGCPERQEGRDIFLIPDRPQAIKKAFSLAEKGDTVLLLGKGHENSIIRKDGPHPYDEADAARTMLKELGYSRI
jgi:UDP-N-acetylmuramoyl-L-alanyl-D-glutamate--2,6-diaminopimelate ligase